MIEYECPLCRKYFHIGIELPAKCSRCQTPSFLFSWYMISLNDYDNCPGLMAVFDKTNYYTGIGKCYLFIKVPTHKCVYIVESKYSKKCKHHVFIKTIRIIYDEYLPKTNFIYCECCKKYITKHEIIKKMRCLCGNDVLYYKDKKNSAIDIDKDKIIYFITDGENIKIGITKNINKRLAQLQTANSKNLRILLTMPGNTYKEKEIHALFANYRINGEWFSLNSSQVINILNENWRHEQSIIS